MALSFTDLRFVNISRCETSFHPVAAWSPCDWMTAVAGECGEAANLVKKLRRIETTPHAHRAEDGTAEEIADRIAAELADLIIYADLLAARLGIDLGKAVVEKFNAVSDRIGSSVSLMPDGTPVVEFSESSPR